MTVEQLSDRSPQEWQHDIDEALERFKLQAMPVIDRKDFYELPLLDALEAEYPERGLNVCGPSSLVLARLLHEDQGLPLTQDDNPNKERLQLFIHSMNNGADDQTNVRYRSPPTGFAVTFDTVLLRIKGLRTKERGAILTEWHYDHNAEFDLRFYWGLERLRAQRVTDVYPNDTPMYYHELLELMHSEHAFYDNYVTASGEEYYIGDFFGQRIQRVYKQVRAATGTTGRLMELLS
jgi:hypothetical protein